MNGFERRKELIKEKIKHTVLAMLQTWESGNIRIADIASEADVSQVTIYNYFGSKEALLREVFKDYVEQKVVEFEGMVASGTSLKAIVQYAIKIDKQAFRSFSPDLIKQLLEEDKELGRYYEELYRERAMPLMVRIIEEGRRKGEISAKVQTSTILAYMTLLNQQSQQLLVLMESSGRGEQFMEELIHLIFYGVCGAEPDTAPAP